MKLTEHFSLEELTATDSGIENTPGEDEVVNLEQVAVTLEAVRKLLGNKPIRVTSGYRSPEVNTHVGGSKTSAHVKGLAVDFVCPTFGSPLDVCTAIAKSGLKFDQLINERLWIHLSVAPESRRQVLVADFGGDRVRYRPGLV